MALTTDQIKTLWYARMQAKSHRYQIMSDTDKATFNANLDLVYAGMQKYLYLHHGNDIIDLVDNTPFNTVDPLAGPGTVPSFKGTRQIYIGADAVGNSISKSVNSQLEQYVLDNNLIFYTGDSLDKDGTPIPNTNGIIEIWQYDRLSSIGPIPYSFTSSIIPATVIPKPPVTPASVKIQGVIGTNYSTLFYDRFQNDMTTWDPLLPDQFAVNKYFVNQLTPNLIVWISKDDPTQQYQWHNCVPYPFNKVSLNLGLNSGFYKADHPELIDSTWYLISHASNQWVWGFNYSDSTYQITLTQQVDNSFLYYWRGKKLSLNDWKTQYIGTNQIA